MADIEALNVKTHRAMEPLMLNWPSFKKSSISNFWKFIYIYTHKYIFQNISLSLSLSSLRAEAKEESNRRNPFAAAGQLTSRI